MESTYEVTFWDSQYASVENVLSDYPFNKKRVVTNNLKITWVYFKVKQGHLQGFINFQKTFLIWDFCCYFLFFFNAD